MRVTIDPAMLLYLDGLNSIKGSPNENYGRELMECFTLGSGNGYTETDVREQARALTGWTANWKNNSGWVDFHFERRRSRQLREVHLQARRRVRLEGLGQAQHHPPAAPALLRQPALELLHPGPTGRDDGERCSSSSTSNSGFQIRPVVSAILRHPLLYEGPRMVKSPVTLHRRAAARSATCGSRRPTGSTSTRAAGQQLFYPPNVMRLERDPLAQHLDLPGALDDRAAGAAERRPQPRQDSQPRAPSERSGQARRLGARLVGQPRASRPQTRNALLNYAQTTMAAAIADPDRMKTFPIMAYNALRHLAACSPEIQTA